MPTLNFYLFFAISHFDSPFTKSLDVFNISKKNAIFYQNGTMGVLCFSHLFTVQEQTFGQRIWDKL
jgi:hypothetical protein